MSLKYLQLFEEFIFESTDNANTLFGKKLKTIKFPRVWGNDGSKNKLTYEGNYEPNGVKDDKAWYWSGQIEAIDDAGGKKPEISFSKFFLEKGNSVDSIINAVERIETVLGSKLSWNEKKTSDQTKASTAKLREMLKAAGANTVPNAEYEWFFEASELFQEHASWSVEVWLVVKAKKR